jgi:hypothetical protein
MKLIIKKQRKASEEMTDSIEDNQRRKAKNQLARALHEAFETADKAQHSAFTAGMRPKGRGGVILNFCM